MWKVIFFELAYPYQNVSHDNETMISKCILTNYTLGYHSIKVSLIIKKHQFIGTLYSLPYYITINISLQTYSSETLLLNITVLAQRRNITARQIIPYTKST